MTNESHSSLLRERTGRVLVIAHRGASGVRPENTLAAFRDAFAEGADGIELDVRATAEGEPVVLHDKTLDRTTNGRGKVSGKITSEVEQLDAGSWFRADFRKERVPLLRQVLQSVPEGVWLDLEIKQSARDEVFLKRLLTLLREGTCLDRVVVTSMNLKVLEHLREAEPALRFGPVVSGVYGSDLLNRGFDLLACGQDVVSGRCLEQAHSRGIAVWVWTVNDLDRAARFARMGVDGIITNYPAQVREVLRELGFWKAASVHEQPFS